MSIAVEIVGNELPIHSLGCAARKDISRHFAFALRLAKQMSAGDHKRFAVMNIDDRACSEAIPGRVLNLDSHRRGPSNLLRRQRRALVTGPRQLAGTSCPLRRS